MGAQTPGGIGHQYPFGQSLFLLQIIHLVLGPGLDFGSILASFELAKVTNNKSRSIASCLCIMIDGLKS